VVKPAETWVAIAAAARRRGGAVVELAAVVDIEPLISKVSYS
jgi:hypothetical protein